ncbi:MAG: AsmA-like C-terminal region-containing protein [Nibricoccus sp.]
MKLIRPLLIGTGIFAVLLAVIMALAFLPSVQTWAVRRVVAGNPSLGVTHVGRVSAGLSRIEVSDVSLAREGLSGHFPSIVIEMPLLAASKNDVQLRRLIAKGWTLDLTPAHSPSTPSAPAAGGVAKPFAFEGIFKLLELPVDLAVDSADVDGLVIFPIKPGQPAGRATVKISGGQLGSKREGRFTIAAETTLPDGLAPVTRLTSTTTLALSMDTAHTFNRVAATIDSYAIGPGVPQGARLLSESSASRESDQESYQVRIKSITAGGEKYLADVAASNRAGEKPFTGTWKFDVSDTDLAPFMLGQVLPEFIFGAAGTFEADRRFQEVKLAGKADITADRLDSVYAGLSALGRLHVLADFDVIHRQTALRVNRLAVDVNGQEPVASVKVLQALEIVPSNGEIKVASPENDLVQVSLKGVPLAWTRLASPSDLNLTGEPLHGELVVRAEQGGFSVRSVSPLLLKNLTVVQSGKTLAKALDVSITAAGSHTPGGWQADVSEIAARSGGVSLFTLSTRAGQSKGKDEPIKATGRIHADFPVILAQPAAAKFRVLGQGVADVEFTASVTSALQQISSRLSLTGLRTNDGQNLPAVSGEFRADIHPDGRIEMNAPLVFDLAGRKSDVELSATLKTEKSGVALSAEVLSRELYVEDLKSFAALQPTAAPAAGSAKPGPASDSQTSAPGTKPIWDGVTGQLRLALKKVIYAANQPPVDVSSTVRITPEALTLESLNAVFPDGAAAKVDGVIKFESAVAEPYDVKANVSATSFDPAPFLKAANPGKSPTVEGKFDLSGKLFGRTSSLDKIADTASLDAQLVSREGRFYGFESSAVAAGIGKLVEAESKVSGLLSMAGGVFGKSELVERGRAVADTARRLGNFNFDQLNVDIAHRPGQSATEIKNFSLISPDLRLLGAGSIDNAAGWSSILQSAMKLDLQMAVRGAQAEDLRILNMLKREPDALGYIAVAENFTVKGSAGKMDASSFFQTLALQAKK